MVVFGYVVLTNFIEQNVCSLEKVWCSPMRVIQDYFYIRRAPCIVVNASFVHDKGETAVSEAWVAEVAYKTVFKVLIRQVVPFGKTLRLYRIGFYAPANNRSTLLKRLEQSYFLYSPFQ